MATQGAPSDEIGQSASLTIVRNSGVGRAELATSAQPKAGRSSSTPLAPPRLDRVPINFRQMYNLSEIQPRVTAYHRCLVGNARLRSSGEESVYLCPQPSVIAKERTTPGGGFPPSLVRPPQICAEILQNNYFAVQSRTAHNIFTGRQARHNTLDQSCPKYATRTRPSTPTTLPSKPTKPTPIALA